MKTLSIATALATALALPTAAQAQNEAPPTETVFDGDYLTIGLGASYSPSYDGSDDYTISALPLVRGSLGGIGISPRPAGVALDLIPDARDAKVAFSLGPVAKLRLDRVDSIKDPVVRRLGKLDTAVEIGANAGITFNDIVTGYDSVTVSTDVVFDVADAHGGALILPSIGYFTPLSKGVAVNFSLSAVHMDDDYANYYFTVTPAGSVVSGLPAFQADGGWKSVGANILLGVDFDGDLTNGGFAAFAIGGYTRLLGDAARTPITRIRGDRDQWTVGAGIAYTF